MLSWAGAAHHPLVFIGVADRVTIRDGRGFRPGAGQGSRTAGRRPNGALIRVISTNDTEPAAVTLDAPLLTADEVAGLLAVPRSSVYEYARRRIDPLPSLLVGRHRRFDRRTVERWLARQLDAT